jgi:hypothetical protein
MKLPLLVTLAFIPCLALAQDATTTPSTSCTNQPTAGEWHHGHHHMSPDQQLAFLSTKLTLSATQQGEIKPVLVSKDEQITAIFQNTSLTEDQKHQQIQAIIESTNQQIEAFLNPAQVEIFKSLHEHHDKPAA